MEKGLKLSPIRAVSPMLVCVCVAEQLTRRQHLATELRQRVDRAQTMADHDLAELRADIKVCTHLNFGHYFMKYLKLPIQINNPGYSTLFSNCSPGYYQRFLLANFY